MGEPWRPSFLRHVLRASLRSQKRARDSGSDSWYSTRELSIGVGLRDERSPRRILFGFILPGIKTFKIFTNVAAALACATAPASSTPPTRARSCACPSFAAWSCRPPTCDSSPRLSTSTFWRSENFWMIDFFLKLEKSIIIYLEVEFEFSYRLIWRLRWRFLLFDGRFGLRRWDRGRYFHFGFCVYLFLYSNSRWIWKWHYNVKKA